MTRAARRGGSGALALALVGGLLLPAAARGQGAASAGQDPGSAGTGLHHRAARAGEGAGAPAPVAATGRTTLPPEAEGEYRWGKLGEVVSLYFERGHLYGYLTARSAEKDDRSAPITFDFAVTHVDGHAVSWTTRTVHGEWWGFDGQLERGLVASPNLPGYYLLAGSLIHHQPFTGDAARPVILKREPGRD